MTEHEHNFTASTEEFRASHSTPIGALIRFALETAGDSSVAERPQSYMVDASVDRTPITHARRLKVLSSIPPLPGYPDGVTDDVFLNTSHVRVDTPVALRVPQGSQLQGVIFTVRGIATTE